MGIIKFYKSKTFKFTLIIHAVMKKEKISFVGKIAKFGPKEENGRVIIIPLDHLTDVRSSFDNDQIKITLEKLKL